MQKLFLMVLLAICCSQHLFSQHNSEEKSSMVFDINKIFQNNSGPNFEMIYKELAFFMNDSIIYNMAKDIDLYQEYNKIIGVIRRDSFIQSVAYYLQQDSIKEVKDALLILAYNFPHDKVFSHTILLIVKTENKDYCFYRSGKDSFKDMSKLPEDNIKDLDDFRQCFETGNYIDNTSVYAEGPTVYYVKNIKDNQKKYMIFESYLAYNYEPELEMLKRFNKYMRGMLDVIDYLRCNHE